MKEHESPPNNRVEVAWTGERELFTAASTRARIHTESGAERTNLSPMELMAAGVGGCMAVDVVDILTKMRQPPVGYHVIVEGWRAEGSPSKFTRLRLTHHVKGEAEMANVERAVELSRTKYCSAMQSLDPAIEIENLIVLDPDQD